MQLKRFLGEAELTLFSFSLETFKDFFLIFLIMARFILSKKKVFEQLEIVKKLADEVSYSLKTNPKVGKVLEEHCWFSVHSVSELNEINNKNKVWFFLQGNSCDEIKKIFSLNVNRFVADNENDLEKLIGTGLKINLLLRMKLKENTIHTGKHFVFGLNSDKINKLLPELRKNKNILELGIHFHRKTQNVSEWNLKEELIDSISEENFSKLDYVNIGGGLPVEYKNYRREVTEQIFDKIRELKQFLNSKNIKMIIEPGRFIAGPSVKLEAEVINIHDNNVIINCSVYNTFMDTFVANIRLLVDGELKEGKKYTIKGCTPDSMDIFRYSVFLKDVKVGDKIVFLNAGAYNYYCDFCGLEKVETIVEE